MEQRGMEKTLERIVGVGILNIGNEKTLTSTHT